MSINTVIEPVKKAWAALFAPFSARQLLIVSLVLLLSVSTVMIASASMPYANFEFGKPYKFIIQQLSYLTLGLIALWFVLKVPLNVWFETTSLLYLLVVVLLCAVFLFHGTNGSHRWIRFVGFAFQPSELAKYVMVLFTADYVVRRQDEIRYFGIVGFFRLSIPLAFVLLLLLLEPDLGSSFVIAASMMAVFFLAGAPARQFFAIISAGIVALFAAIMMSDYRRERLMSFVIPCDDPKDTDYQLCNSLQAFAHGEWLGTGLGHSVQKLLYLPEAHTDFLLAIIGEELGFVGVSFVFVLLAVLIAAIMRIAHRALLNRHERAGYLAYGIAIIFLLQVFVNGGMNMGLLPTKGLTLPFVSYGGSALLVYLGMIGVVLRIERETRQPVPRTARQAYLGETF